MADTPIVDESTAELDDLRADVLNLTERVSALETMVTEIVTNTHLKLANWVLSVENTLLDNDERLRALEGNPS